MLPWCPCVPPLPTSSKRRARLFIMQTKTTPIQRNVKSPRSPRKDLALSKGTLGYRQKCEFNFPEHVFVRNCCWCLCNTSMICMVNYLFFVNKPSENISRLNHPFQTLRKNANHYRLWCIRNILPWPPSHRGNAWCQTSQLKGDCPKMFGLKSAACIAGIL